MKWLPLLLCCSALSGAPHLPTLHRSLDPTSLHKQLAFYHLYPDSEEGKQALDRAWKLLFKERGEAAGERRAEAALLLSLIDKAPFETEPLLDEEQLRLIEHLGSHLANRTLKGHSIESKEDLLNLESEEIDLARALLLYQFEEAPLKRREYEALLDLMTMQILARLPENATEEEKVEQISQFIFHEKRFRFPPHSRHANEIDTYTFLPSVLDGREGVCLGVSTLYLAIADRMGLSLEIITPPGHIYLRHKERNIETTARGIHLPSSTYLSINTRSLHERTKKEVVGLNFMNEAARLWHEEKHEEAMLCYEKALPYLPEDPLIKRFLGYNCLFAGKKKRGEQLLKSCAHTLPDHAIYAETAAEDYLKKRVNIEGLKALFLTVDESRESIITKQQVLKKVVAKYPKFREGLIQLAITHLQLDQKESAYALLQGYLAIDSTNPIVAYYLAHLSMHLLRYHEAWEQLKNAEQLCAARSHYPIALKRLRTSLHTLCRDPASAAEELTVIHLEEKSHMLTLSNGSKWRTSPQDWAIAQLWLIPNPLAIEKSDDPNYPYRIINLQTGSSILVAPA